MSTELEPLGAEHYALAARWLSRPEINRWLYAEWRHRKVDEKLLAVAAMNRKNRMWLVRHGEIPCGLVALSDINTQDRAAIVWYLLGKDNLAGHGVITDAVGQMTRLVFRDLQLRSLSASIMAGNQSSRRVLEKNGFRRVGVLRCAFRDGESFTNRIVYDLLPEDLAELSSGSSTTS